MVDDDIIRARIRRNGFREAAGDYFVDSELAMKLCAEFGLNFDDFLLGVYKNKNCWTCVFKKETFFTKNSPLLQVNNHTLAAILDRLFYADGKSSEKELVEIQPGRSMWIANNEVAFAMENTFLLIAK